MVLFRGVLRCDSTVKLIITFTAVLSLFPLTVNVRKFSGGEGGELQITCHYILPPPPSIM